MTCLINITFHHYTDPGIRRWECWLEWYEAPLLGNFIKVEYNLYLDMIK